MKQLLKASSFVQVDKNYVEPNPTAYPEFDFFAAVTPANGGKQIPSVFLPGALAAAEAAAKKAGAYVDGVSPDTAILATLPGAPQKLKLRAKLEALILKLRTIVL